MPLRKREGSPYWQIRFELAGIEYRRSSGTTDKAAAEALEQQFRTDLWRQIRLGEKRHTWDEAVERYTAESSHQPSWERTERILPWFKKHLEGRLLAEITYDAILKLRTLRQGEGASLGTINREFSVLRAILRRSVDPWKLMDAAPKVPMFRLPKVEPRWISREQALALLDEFPPHLKDMMQFALATGLRRSNVTGMEWSRIDMKRRTAYVPGNQAKGREAITVKLNDDAIEALKNRLARLEKMKELWPKAVQRYVFIYRGRAPIKQVTTATWRAACLKLGLQGVTFHSMRHSWASWQVQSGTPLKMVQEMGGWASLEMVMRYAHLNPGHLAQYADRVLLREKTSTTDNQDDKPEPRAVSAR